MESFRGWRVFEGGEFSRVESSGIRITECSIIYITHASPDIFHNLKTNAYPTHRYSLNNNLIASFQQRVSNHQELLQSLREINRFIQVAASMRMGRAKKSVVSACRACLKRSQFASMIEVIRSGRSSNNVSD